MRHETLKTLTPFLFKRLLLKDWLNKKFLIRFVVCNHGAYFEVAEISPKAGWNPRWRREDAAARGWAPATFHHPQLHIGESY